jgi:hypothetical protein
MRRFTSCTGLLALVLSSCDPGFHVVPVGWQKLESGHFEQRIGDLRIETTSVGGLTGEWWVGVDFLVTDAKKPVVPKAIVLVTNSGRFRGKLREAPHYLPANVLSQKGAALLAADWDFPKDTTLPKTLSGSPTVEVSFFYGGEPRSFTVIYHRE